jgi:hypothetical protein
MRKLSSPLVAVLAAAGISGVMAVTGNLVFAVGSTLIGTVASITLKIMNLQGAKGLHQLLVVCVPVGLNTPDKMLTLLLDRDDAHIFAYLRKHGRVKGTDDATTVEYGGRQAYFPTKNFFLFPNCGYFPKQVKIISCAGFDLLR